MLDEPARVLGHVSKVPFLLASPHDNHKNVKMLNSGLQATLWMSLEVVTRFGPVNRRLFD